MFAREHASFVYFKEGFKQKQKNQPLIYLFLHFPLKLARFWLAILQRSRKKGLSPENPPSTLPSVKIMGLLEGVNPSDFSSAKKSTGCCYVCLHTWFFQEDQQIHVHSSCDVAPFLGCYSENHPFLRDSQHFHICSERWCIPMSLSICHHLLTGPVRRW